MPKTVLNKMAAWALLVTFVSTNTALCTSLADTSALLSGTESYLTVDVNYQWYGTHFTFTIVRQWAHYRPKYSTQSINVVLCTSSTLHMSSTWNKILAGLGGYRSFHQKAWRHKIWCEFWALLAKMLTIIMTDKWHDWCLARAELYEERTQRA